MSTELAWAAGFFDGDGSTCTTKQYKVKPRRLKLQIGQCHPFVLERFCAAVEEGKVYGPYHKTSALTKRPYWLYHIENDLKVNRVLDKLWPYLSQQKKAQATRARADREESKL